VTDGEKTVLAVFRMPGHPAIRVSPLPESDLPAWSRLRREWEKPGQTGWTFGDLPEKIPLDDRRSDIPLCAVAALQDSGNHVDLRLFGSSRLAGMTHHRGVTRLLELVLAADFGWLEKEVVISKETAVRCAAFAKRERIQAALFSSVKKHVFSTDYSAIRSREAFDAEARRIKNEIMHIRGTIAPLFDKSILLLTESLSQIDRSARMHPSKNSSAMKTTLKAEGGAFLAALFQPDFTYSRLLEYPRYLAAFRKRVEVAFDDPSRYRQSVSIIEVLVDKADKLKDRKDQLEIRDMIEELAISLFAQQSVKTKFPVSEKRILERIASLAA
jgi:ATP-dependent helicase HrpA